MHNQLIILGGMGPQASLRLHELLLQKSRTFHNGAPDAYPAILHASMQIPDFIENTQNVEPAMAVIRQNCARLPLDSASAIGLACNTAHMLLPDLPLNRDNFVSMIHAVVSDIAKLGVTSVGLLASPHTIKTKLYEDVLKACGIGVVLPNAAELRSLSTIIREVISGTATTTNRLRLSRIAANLEARGANAMLLGCTELPLVGVDTELPVVDSLSSLADAMLLKNNRTAV
jgi:aspartate racemase